MEPEGQLYLCPGGAPAERIDGTCPEGWVSLSR